MAKQQEQDTSKNEITRFGENVHEGRNILQDYSNFMEELFQKGYPETSPNVSDGNKWYIPHHGVYHPAKPRKIRVVFDCSAEYLKYALNK